MFDLTGKIALITGATGGIGQAIAKQMKDRGAKLILSGTRENVLNQMVKDLGDDVKSVVSNLQDKDSILSMEK
jgi:3-oxoacyl-[acyl-carrier protein] reductase